MIWLGMLLNWPLCSIHTHGYSCFRCLGLALAAPISSAALAIMMDLSGLAAGAATVGCSAQMIGFAVASYRDNGWGGADCPGRRNFHAAGAEYCQESLDTAAAHLGFRNTWAACDNYFSNGKYGLWCRHGDKRFRRAIRKQRRMGFSLPVLGKIVLLHYLLPAVIALLCSEWMRKRFDQDG